MNDVSPAVCRAARALLDWNQDELSKASGVSPSALRNFELGRSVPMPNNLAAIRSAFEKAGVELIEESGRVGAALRSLDA